MEIQDLPPKSKRDLVQKKSKSQINWMRLLQNLLGCALAGGRWGPPGRMLPLTSYLIQASFPPGKSNTSSYPCNWA